MPTQNNGIFFFNVPPSILSVPLFASAATLAALIIHEEPAGATGNCTVLSQSHGEASQSNVR